MKNEGSKSTLPPELLAERSLLFFKGQFVYSRRTERGGRSYKFLSPAAVSEAFRGAPVDTGWLAPQVARCGQTARGDFAVLFIPAARHALAVEGIKGGKVQALDVWLPPLLFFGLGGSYYVWALKADWADPGAILYRAPLPNVFESAGICWGQNTPPRASAQTITEAWKLFISSPFNGHAATDKVRGQAGEVRPYLRKLAQSKRKFPAGDLIPAGRHGSVTVDAAIGALIEGGGE